MNSASEQVNGPTTYGPVAGAVVIVDGDGSRSVRCADSGSKFGS